MRRVTAVEPNSPLLRVGAANFFLMRLQIKCESDDTYRIMQTADRKFDDSFRLALEKASLSAAEGYNPFSLVLIDVDAFAEIEDTYGPKVSHDLLSMIDGYIRADLRSVDALSVDSRANFSLLLANSLTSDGALVCVERIREKIASTPIYTSEPLLVSITGAVATWQSGLSVDDLLDAADSTLRAAKLRGSNHVEVWVPDRA